jgi:inner membrane protein
VEGNTLDTITHTLFGLTLYGAVDKSRLTKQEKRALLFTSLAGSQIPDIDVVSAWWDTAGRYQMWHRGLTHSVFLVPIWAGLIAVISQLVWRVGLWRWYGLGMLAVFIHDSSDLFNAWGTGYYEPFSAMRVTFGTVPIVDLVFWAWMLIGLLVVRFGRGRWKGHQVYRAVWGFMLLHVVLQSVQGYTLYQKVSAKYEQVALSADFVPGVFTVVGKKGEQVDLLKGSIWKEPAPIAQLTSAETADLSKLYAENPKARTLKEWSPFVVVVDDASRLGIYDPRFYRNGESFLFEYMEKK